MGGDSEFDQPPLKRLKVWKPPPKFLQGGSPTSGVSAGSGAPMARELLANDGETLGSQGQIRKVEFVRVITQALFSLGYQHAGTVLEQESGISLQSSAVLQFKKDVLAGHWDKSLATLTKMGSIEEDILKAASFLILQHKFLEFLDQSDPVAALKTLRTEISPLGINRPRVHQLANLIVCPSRDVLLEKANWKGAGEDSRCQLLEELQQLLPPSIMIPERRLEHLVEQALERQRGGCIYHNTLDHALSLYEEYHECSRDHIPTQTSQVLEAHEDEVWFLRFSHDGRYLASASKDCTAIIWEVLEDDSLVLRHRFMGHSKPVSVVSWSPDDTMLLTCGNEEVVKLWDTSTGECKLTLDTPTSCFTACAWFPDNQRFVSGGVDKCIYMWDLEGRLRECWKGARMSRIDELAVSLDGGLMVSICAYTDIRLYNLKDKTERVFEEEKPITSLSVSKDGKCLLVSLQNQEIHRWEIEQFAESSLNSPRPAKYKGHRQGRYAIKSCFGGTDDIFVVSGSEDSQVYIWHNYNGALLEVLPGHSGTVNCVSWNPVIPHMFASGSDDHTIRIWGLNKKVAAKESGAAGNSNGNTAS